MLRDGLMAAAIADSAFMSVEGGVDWMTSVSTGGVAMMRRGKGWKRKIENTKVVANTETSARCPLDKSVNLRSTPVQ